MAANDVSPIVPIRDYDEVHAISDLHLGGEPGFQMFRMGEKLAALIGYLRQKPPAPSAGRLALVINGDFTDFLAETPPRHFDPFEAIRKLQHIEREPSFRPVFEALRAFIATADRTLIINIGNHDLELALPWVRDALFDLLTAGDANARSRVALVSDGTGVRCRVGSTQVLCVHGNEVDAWNVVDHEALRCITRDLYQGRAVDPWTPNAGTKMVIDVMNELKQRFRFVDLLKPEAQAVVPTLLALDPRVATRLPRVVPIGARGAWDRLKMAAGLLETEDPASTTGSTRARIVSAAAPQAPPAVRIRRERAQALAAALLDQAEVRLQAGDDAMTLIGSDEATSQLGMAGAIWNAARGDTLEALREALEHLEGDRSFEVGEEDETYRLLDERMGPDITFLVAGHTHLARALPRKAARGYYLNTGTWARLIHLAPDVLRNKTQFATVFEAFRSGTMEALDLVPKLVIDRPTFASICRNGASTRAELREYDSALGASPFKVVSGPFIVG